MKPGTLLKLLLCIVVLTVACGLALGQGTTSRISGTVRDANGAAISGALVTLLNEGTSVSLTTQTSESGTFTFDLVQVGTYTVTVEKDGFKKFQSSGNSLNVNQPATINATLDTGGVSETVNVPAGIELVQTLGGRVCAQRQGRPQPSLFRRK